MSASAGEESPLRRWPRIALLVLGLGLALAPVMFGMFSKGPDGATMLGEFKPFMTTARLDGFQSDLAYIGNTVGQGDEAITSLGRLPGQTSKAAAVSKQFGPFVSEWPEVDADMGGMLKKIKANLPNYRAMAGLPSFRLFPFFFLIPGLAIAVAALVGLIWPWRWARARWPVLGIGVALVIAPFAFGLFGAGPKGASMMTTFKTIETSEHLERLQSYFTEIVEAQGVVALNLLPDLRDAGLSNAEIDRSYPALPTLDHEWIHVLNDMTPMLAAMSDNIANYQAMRSLPSFKWFPWFFLLPGLIVIGLALIAGRFGRAVPKPRRSSHAITSQNPPGPGGSGRRAVTVPR